MISPAEPEIRRLWDKGRDTATIARIVGLSEARTAQIVSAYVSQKAWARRAALSTPTTEAAE